MAILDFLKVKKIKQELAQTKEERDSLKQSFEEIEKLDYLQLKQAIQLLVTEKENKVKDLQSTQEIFSTRSANSTKNKGFNCC